MNYLTLNKMYFDDHSNFRNMLDPNNRMKQIKRPYAFLKIVVDDISFLIPLRSNLNHPNGFKIPSSLKTKAGLDYSHALVYPQEKYILNNRVIISNEQYNMVKKNQDIIKKEFRNYIREYKKAVERGYVNKMGKFKNSTLVNFNKELGVKNEQEERRSRQAAYLRRQGYER